MQIQETLRVYTEDKQLIGKMLKEEYHNIEKVKYKGKEVEPWVECVTCFIICKNDKTIAIQKRAETELDPGELDIVSGHVRDGEINRTAMMREMKEEMGMKDFSRMDLARDLIYCGSVKMDFSKSNKHNKNKNLRCFATVYAFVVDDKSRVFVNEDAVAQMAWANYYDVKKAIRASMFRFPYTDENSEVYEKIFKNIDQIVEGKEFCMSASEYEQEWL